MRTSVSGGLAGGAGEGRKPTRDIEGYLFAYEITETRFRLNLLRFLPIAWIRLDRIRYIRQRSGDGALGALAEIVAHPFKSWYWPHPWMDRSPMASAPYVIRMESGRQVFVRLRAGHHYRLRSAMGNARARAEEP